MKILIISDTHRKHDNLLKVLERECPVDLLIHLGDAEGYEDYIAEQAGCPVEVVAGNNDFFSSLPREKELQIGKYKVLITHGHYYYVNTGIEDIEREAEGRGFDIVMFGHTHRPIIDYHKDVIALNPGSLSYPRQEGKRPSYIIMQWVSALAATAGGTLTSKQKIKLEAYIQMNYLDRILRYANTRLMQMTAGQYELERIGAENQRSQSGLDLGVIDHYNGTRRSVKTLSGGESFKASLALALGLSDEVQSSAGGIRLDTLFLDEGFGSLDEESLEPQCRCPLPRYNDLCIEDR